MGMLMAGEMAPLALAWELAWELAGEPALRLWLRGLGLGLAIAAPVGPIGILCIRRTLGQGWGVGLVSGLGAATADAIYGCVAALGLGVLAGWLVAQRSLLQGGGGLFLLYLGVQAWRQPRAIVPAPETVPNQLPHQSQSRAYISAYGSTLALTLTNPATILAFGAIFAGAGLGESAARSSGSAVAALGLIFGIFCGSASWWLLLCGLTYRLGRVMTARQLGWIGRGSGVVLGGFGLAVLLHLALGMDG